MSGGEFGGWTLYLKDGKLCYAHNYLKVQEYLVASSEPVTPGKHQLSVHFTPTGTFKKPDYFTGDVVLAIDGEKVAELENIRVAGQYSAVTGYGLLIGRNTGTPISSEYKAPFPFTGAIKEVQIELGQLETTVKPQDAIKEVHIEPGGLETTAGPQFDGDSDLDD